MAKTKHITLEELELAASFISVEAVMENHSSSSAITKLVELKSMTTSFIKSSFSNIVKYLSWSKGEADPYAYYKSFAENNQYLAVKNIPLEVPMGFKGNYVDYTNALVAVHTEVCSKLVPEMIKPFDIYVAKLINQPILLESHSFKHSIKPADIEKHRTTLAKFATPKKHNSLPLDHVYGRIKDIAEHRTALLTLKQLVEVQDIQDVQKAVEELDNKLNTLVGILSEKTSNINPTDKVVKDLAELTLALAKQVEFYAIVDNMIGVLFQHANSNVNVFKRNY